MRPEDIEEGMRFVVTSLKPPAFDRWPGPTGAPIKVGDILVVGRHDPLLPYFLADRRGINYRSVQPCDRSQYVDRWFPIDNLEPLVEAPPDDQLIRLVVTVLGLEG